MVTAVACGAAPQTPGRPGRGQDAAPGAMTNDAASAAMGEDASTLDMARAGAAPSWKDESIARGGTRLRVRWTEAEGGAQLFRGFYDIVLKTPCSFRRAADSQMRCLPEGFEHYGQGAIRVIPAYYEDAACSRRVAHVSVGCAVHPYVVLNERPANTCQYQARIFERGAEVNAGTVFEDVGSCKKATPGPETRTYLTGQEVPPDRFVRALPRELSGTLAKVMLEAEDGAHVFQTWRWNGAECGRLELSDGSERCVPRVPALLDIFYADNQCTQPSASFSYICPEIPMVVRQTSTCPPRTEYLLLGEPRSSGYFKSTPAVGSGETRTCTAIRLPPTATYGYAPVTGPVDPRAFPQLESRPDEAGPRVRLLYEMAQDGQRRPQTFFDSQRNEPCSPTQMGPDLRCAPRKLAVLTNYFEDPECKRALASGPAGCPPRYAYRYSVPGCGDSVRYLRVGSEFKGGQPFEQISVFDPMSGWQHVCRPRTLPSSSAYYTTEEIPDAAFPLLRYIEPAAP